MRELSLHLLDIIQNSIEAGASRVEVEITADTNQNLLYMCVKDNGRGMDEEFIKKVKNPFVTTRTTRRVGLGIPMLVAAAEMCDGYVDIQSEPGKGTKVKAVFGLNHIDRAPLGDLVNTMVVVIAANPNLSLLFKYRVDDKEFCLDTDEVKANLEGVPINDPMIIRWIKDYLTENIKSVGVIQ